MKKAKRPLTLLEVMIALSLTAILIFVLFSTYRQVTLTQLDLSKGKEQVISRNLMQLRLMQVLPCAGNVKDSEEDEPAILFYTQEMGSSKALIFVYDNKVDVDPNFCDEVQGMIYLNRKKELCLITWPNGQAKNKRTDDLGRKEVLISGVERLNFEFFDPPDPQEWKKDWEKDAERLPSMVKLIVKDAREEMQFAFFLQESEEGITYKKKKS